MSASISNGYSLSSCPMRAFSFRCSTSRSRRCASSAEAKRQNPANSATFSRFSPRKKGSEDVEIRVWDSTAEVRYLVLPERPAASEKLSEEELAGLVTRDAMVGVAKVNLLRAGANL
jgi:hypothetical protein